MASGKKIEDVAEQEGIDRRRVGEWAKAKEKLAMKKNKRSTFKADSEKELAMFPLLETAPDCKTLR